LVGPEIVDRLARLQNVVPMLSLEGTAAQTDRRRGEGTYRCAVEVMRELRKRRTFFGCSITLTSDNFSTALDEEYASPVRLPPTPMPT
jgi:MoaA/NifB/PqqE/SkfB family radical SAM enzyme